MTLSAINLVNVGTNPNDGTGDSIRTAFQTVNNNFSYITSYTFPANLMNGSVVDGTQGYKKIVLNTTNSVGLSNVWVTLPISASDGQELRITSLIPITSCFVNQNGQNIKWLANGFFSSGNVTATLTYTTLTNSWMTF